MESKTTVDEAMTTLSHLYIMSAQYLLEVMNKAVKKYCLDTELTPEMKRRIKTDLGFTSQAVSYLTDAHKHWEGLMRDLDLIEQGFNNRLLCVKQDYDKQVANMHDLLSVDLPYVMLTYGNPENEKKIHAYLKKYTWPQELTDVYRISRARKEAFSQRKK